MHETHGVPKTHARRRVPYHREKLFKALHADLQPWVDRKVTPEQCNATRQLAGRAGLARVGGRVFQTSGVQWLYDEGVLPRQRYPFCKAAQALLRTAERDVNAANIEFFVRLGDRPMVRQGEFDDGHALTIAPCSIRGVPGETYYDVRAPHWYVQPDEFCSWDNLTAFDEREPKLFGRYTHFCPWVITSRRLPEEHAHMKLCQRTYFAQLAYRNVSDVAMDVGFTNVAHDQMRQALFGKPEDNAMMRKQKVPMSEWGKYKYLLVTEGWTFVGKLANVLALGSVVLMPQSVYRQYFEDLLVPGEHFVPLWTRKRDDVLDVLKWLESHQEKARSIAKAGRDIACMALVASERDAWWDEFVTSAANETPNRTVSMAELAGLVERHAALELTSSMMRIDDAAAECVVDVPTFVPSAADPALG